ncbi:MAG: PAS-domain containing protein [Rubrivivax sp.]|nr:PAS-domain containing protein [Rubrivivax sp.]
MHNVSSTTPAGVVDDHAVRAESRREQVQGHVRSLGAITLGSLGGALLAVWMLQGQAPVLALGPWLLLMAAVLGLRWLMARRVQAQAAAGADVAIGSWLPWLQATALLHGLAWGSLALLPPDPLTAESRVALVLIIGAVALAGMMKSLYDGLAAAWFACAAVAPMALRVALFETVWPRYELAGGVMLLLVGSGLALTARLRQKKRRELALARVTETERHRRAQDNEALLRRVLDHLGEGVAMFDSQQRLVAWNQHMIELSGADAALARPGVSLREMMQEMASRGEFGELGAEAAAARRKAVTALPGAQSVRRVRPDGRVVETRRTDMPDGGFTLVAIDITAREAAEQSNQRHERTLQLLLQNTEQGVWFVDNEQRTTDVNPAMCRLLGLERSELMGRRIFEFVDADNEAIFRHQIQRRAQGFPDSYEVSLRRSDGTLVHCQNNPTPLFDAAGVKIGAVGLFTDISAIRHASAELQQTSELLAAKTRVLESTLDSLSQGVLSIAADGHIEAWNRRALDLTQVPEPQLRQQPTLRAMIEWQMRNSVLTPQADARGKSWFEAATRYVGGDGSALWTDLHYRRQRSDGRVIEVQLHPAPDGAQVRTYTDVTERVAAERSLIAARDEAERANRAKSEFLSRMSHELRTPLNAVLGFAQLIASDRAEPPSESQLERVRQIQRGGAHLLQLINEVLDLARIESGTLALQPVDVDLDQVMRECLQMIEPMARERGVELQLHDLPAGQARLHTDVMRLRQVLLNLLSNAVKYNQPGGGVSIGGWSDAQTLRLEISDTGPGLSAEHQQRLFQAFERLDADRSAVEGTGIGLALSKALMELMGGRIGVRSQPGVGSTFWVEWPRGCAADAGAPASSTLADAPAPADATLAAVAGRVLYIEDNPVNQIVVEGMLSSLPQVSLSLASDPETGLQMAQSQPLDLVLLDIQLPGMDGYEVLRRLRAHSDTRALPVVAVSANAMAEDLERARDAGFDDYLTKPLDLRLLLSVVAHRLARGRA